MKWTAVWSEKAEKGLTKLPKEDAKRIILKTSDVEEDPFSYLERMTNSPFYKFRVGMCRIIIVVVVDVVNDKLILHMVKVKERSRVYN